MGRQLKSISNGTNTYSYTYNEEGVRTSKTVNGITTNYVIDNKLVKAEYTDTYSIVYWYDDTDSIVGFFYTDKTVSNPTTQAYIYTKNAQGDVTGILNSSGTKVVSYSYDSWGNVLSITGSLSSTIGTINPIRYRGYYYDAQTNYYYLQSRYYNPEWCRFINADDAIFIGISGNVVGVNAFAYCENNSINNIDSSGYWVATIGVSCSATVVMGVSFSAAIVFDGKGNVGLLIVVYVATFGYGSGPSWFFGYFWKYKNVNQYINAVMNTHSVGFGYGVDIVHDYPNYPRNYKARLVGIQLTGPLNKSQVFNPTLMYTPNSVISYYIPLNKHISNTVKEIKKFIKKLKIKLIVKR